MKATRDELVSTIVFVKMALEGKANNTKLYGRTLRKQIQSVLKREGLA